MVKSAPAHKDSAPALKESTPASESPAGDSISSELTWRQPAFWRNMFLYYWFFSFFGHILEVVWAWIIKDPANPGPIPTITPLAPPYGLGVVALILIVSPIYKRFKKMNILVVFLLSTTVVTTVEYLCSVVIVAVLGNNPFWDYSLQPYNFYGHIYLQNALLLGLVATLLLRFALPHIQKLTQKFSKKFLDDLFILLSVTYAADLAFMAIKWLMNK